MKKVNGILVLVDDFGGFESSFSPQCVNFAEDKPSILFIRRPTEFYRYIGGKRFLVYADEERLKENFNRVLTLAVTKNGKLTNDRLFGNLFICNADEKNRPKRLTKADKDLILSQVAVEYFDYFPTKFLKAEMKENYHEQK